MLRVKAVNEQVVAAHLQLAAAKYTGQMSSTHGVVTTHFSSSEKQPTLPPTTLALDICY